MLLTNVLMGKTFRSAAESKIEKLDTHAHTYTFLHGLEECQQDKGNEPRRGRQCCQLQNSNPFKSGKNVHYETTAFLNSA